MKRALALIVLIATPAAAQTTTTNCYGVVGRVNCTSTTTQPLNALGAAADGYALAESMRRAQAEREAAAEARTRANNFPAQLAVVRDMNAHNECSRSVEFAARTGDRQLIDLALSCQAAK